MDRTYSIKDLELLSGIRAHTLRIWEKRYDLFRPLRTDTNIRRYSQEDLRLLLNVAILKRKGYKISRIAGFAPLELEREAYRLLSVDHSTDMQVDGLRHAMINLREDEFNKVFSNLTMCYGFEDAMIKAVYPFLSMIGDLWQTGAIDPRHEHFASCLVRQKLIVAIDMLPVPPVDTERGFVLACPEQEYHEMGLLFTNYLLRSRGVHTVYAGASVPLKDLSCVLKESGIRRLLLYMLVHPALELLPDYLDSLQKAMPRNTRSYLAGRLPGMIDQDQVPHGMKVLYSATDLIQLLSDT